MLVPFNLDFLPKITCFGFVSYKESWMHFKRKTDEYIVYIIKKGELYIKEGDHKYELKKNDFLLLQPNRMHIGYEKACCDYYYIHFKQEEMPDVSKPLDEIVKEILKKRSESLDSDPRSYFDYSNSLCYLPKHFHMADESVSSHFMYVLKDSLEQYNKKLEHYRIIFSCKLLEILISISKEYVATEIEKHHSTYSRSYLKIEAIHRYINSNYNKKINSWDIEQEFGFNYDYLNRIFHKLTGHTILNYLSIVRINRAKELIEHTTMNLSEITFAVGISDPYYFSKTFKKITGISPLVYRKNRYRV
jgi:YesN/AraC family two-component response regulator